MKTLLLKGDFMLNKILLNGLDPLVDEVIVNLFTKDYSKNPYVNITAVQKIGIKNVIEAQLRAETGDILSRPYGSNIGFSPWDKLLLSPRQLFELPTASLDEINTETIIGKNCSRPLILSMPIMVTGMSYGGSLSLKMKTAIAKGTKIAGTSTNTGESTISKEERRNSKYIIGQLNRANLLKEKDFDKLDALEIQLGQGAWGGGVESITKATDIDSRLRNDWDLEKGEDQLFKARMDGINSKEDLINLVSNIKSKYNFPVGIKIAATNFIEKELDVITATSCDYIVIDGCEGGTAVAPPTLEDNLGLPTLYALIRTMKYLEKHNIKDKFDVIIAGGLVNTGHFLKALSLGASAVYIGSIAVFATIHNQATKTTPDLPPTQLALNNGKKKNSLNIEVASKSLANFLNSCNKEMKMALQAMGKTCYKELSKKDLVCLDKVISEYANIDFVL